MQKEKDELSATAEGRGQGKIKYLSRKLDRDGFPKAGEVVIYDLEWTAWAGSAAANWSRPGEVREVIQIGAVIADAGDRFSEQGRLNLDVKPSLNPVLSDYIVALTGVTQQRVDAAASFADAMKIFSDFCGDRPLYCNGNDGGVIEANATLIGEGPIFDPPRYHDAGAGLHDALDLKRRHQTGDLLSLLGEEPVGPIHDALGDALTLRAALEILRRKDLI